MAAELEESLREAAQLLRHADALLVVSEAPPDSFSPPAPSDNADAEQQGQPSEDPWEDLSRSLCTPSLFQMEPRLAWGAWLAHYRHSQDEQLSGAYSLVQAWAQRTTLGGFALDAGVEGRWQRSGWASDRVLEVNGSLRQLQCSAAGCEEPPWDAPEPLGIESDPHTNRAAGELPVCPRCGAVARPAVRMGQDDEGFSSAQSGRQGDNYAGFMAFLTSLRDPGLSVVFLYLPGKEEAPSEGARGFLEQAASWNLRMIRAGPKEQAGFPEQLAERSIWVRLEAQEALSRLNDRIAACGTACYVVMDPDGNGAEVLGSMDLPVMSVFRRVNAEMSWEVVPGPEGEGKIVIAEILVASAGGVGHLSLVDPYKPVPQNFFAVTRDQVPTARLRVGGSRYPRQNARLLSREGAVRNLLQDLCSAFSSEEYQARLTQCGDQIDVRDLVKEVHLTLLPQHGFELNRDMDFKESFQVQTRMQSFINSVLPYATSGDIHEMAPLRKELHHMAHWSLELSGIAKLAALPARRKGRTKAQRVAPLVLKAFNAETAAETLPPGSKPFRNSDPKAPVLYGGWLGPRRAPTAFMQAPSEELAAYLRDDPDGPFVAFAAATGSAEKAQDAASAEYEVTVDDMVHWHKWGFEVDEHERIMKADWHTLPGVGDKAKLFIPRLGKPGSLGRAPPRCMAFAEAFRLANMRCWSALAQGLSDLQVKRELEHDYTWTIRGSRLVGSLIRCLTERGHFGVMEAQVWWGNRVLTLPSHKDGATSLLHLGVTLSGRRTVRVGAFAACETRAGQQQGPQGTLVAIPVDEDTPEERENVWDDGLWTQLKRRGERKDFAQNVGSIYLSAPYCFEHGVRFEASTKQQPIASLQCRFAFEPGLGREMNRLRDNVMWDISAVITEVLRRMCAGGFLRMPSLEEVQRAERELGASEKMR